MIVGEDENVPEPLIEGAFGQNGGEFAIFRTDRQLAALQTAANMLGKINEKKSLDLFRQRLAPERHRQSRAASRHRQCGDARRRLVLHGGCARPGCRCAHGRRHAAVAGRHRGLLRRGGDDHDFEPAALPGYALVARGRHRRQGAARCQRSDGGHRAGAEGHRQLLRAGLLHFEHSSRWQAAQDQDHARGRPLRRAGVSRQLLRRQGVQEVHHRRQRTAARRCLHAGRPDHRTHHGDGGELLSVESRRILRARRHQDPRQRTGACQARRRRAHADRLPGRDPQRAGRPTTFATRSTSS